VPEETNSSVGRLASTDAGNNRSGPVSPSAVSQEPSPALRAASGGESTPPAQMSGAASGARAGGGLVVNSPSAGQLIVRKVADGFIVPASGSTDPAFGVTGVGWQWVDVVSGATYSGSATSTDGFKTWQASIPLLGMQTIAFFASNAFGLLPPEQNVPLTVALQADILDVDPRSYLSALIEFGTEPFKFVAPPGGTPTATARITTNGAAQSQSLTLATIHSSLYQSVTDLLNEDNLLKANEPVRQTRICVEVLRKYLLDNPPTAAQAAGLKSAEAAYCQAAYFSLLSEIGTSYDEIRLARTYSRTDPTDQTKLQTIADRLGIELGSGGDGTPDHLSQLCLDPYGTPDIPLAFRLTVVDGNNVTSGATVNVIVPGIKRVFTASAGPNQTVNQGTAVTLTGTTFVALGSTVVAYQWAQISGPSVTLNNSTSATTSFAPGSVATDTVLMFRFTATDNAGATASATVNVTVYGASRALTVNAGASQTVNQGEGVTLTGSAKDTAAGTTIKTYNWTQIAGPPVTLLNANSPVASFEAPAVAAPVFPLSEQILEQTFGLVDTSRDPFSQGPTIGDTQGLIARWNLKGAEWNRGTDLDGIAYLQVSIGAAGSPTQLNLFNDRGRTTVLASGQGRTPGEITLSPVNNSGISGRILIGNNGLDDLIGLTIYPRFLSWQYQRLRNTWSAEDIPADTMIAFQLTATNTAGASATATTTVTVSHVARPLFASAGGNQTVRPGDTVRLIGSAADATPGATISYHWRQIAGPAVTLTNAGTANASFVAPVLDTDTVLAFEFDASNGSGAFASAVADITVYASSHLLTISAGANQSVAEGTTVTLLGKATELNPRAAVTSNQWTQTGGTPVTLSNAKTPTASFVAPAGGGAPLTFQFKASDSTGAAASATVNIIAVPVGPHGPAILVDAGPSQAANFGTTVTLAGNAVTTGGEIDWYRWTQTGGPSVTVSNGNANTASFVAPAVRDDALLTFQLTVSYHTDQGTHDSASCTANVTVFRANHSLMVSAGASQMVNEAALVTLSGSAADVDPDGGSKTYQWAQISGPPVTLANPNAAVTTFIAPTETDASGPIIDPDLLIKGDFRDPFEPAYSSIYVQRQQQIQGWLTTLRDARQSGAAPFDGLNAMLATALSGKQFSDLQSLDDQRQAGKDILPQLNAMRVSLEAFNQIVQLGMLIKGGQPILDLEWSDLDSILVQAQKIENLPAWRYAERTAGLSLSPEFFTSPPRLPDAFATGVDATGDTLLDGAQDPHWTIIAISTPGGTVGPAAPAYVTKDASPVGTSWISNTSTSRWISLRADESFGADAPGFYTYRTAIDLTGYDPGSVTLAANIAVDREIATVILNGKDLGIKATGFASFTVVMIDGPFQAGGNTLDIVVYNPAGGGPTGLRVEMSFTTPPVLAAFPRWRATLQERQSWQHKLQGRIGQDDYMLQDLQSARDATEEATLAGLRDALVQACSLTSSISSIFSTGVNTDRSVLADGAIDSHWRRAVPVTITPPHGAGFPGTEYFPVYATNNAPPVGNPWIANSPTSRWISLQAIGSTGDAPGSYTYETLWDLSGFDPQSIKVDLKVAADDRVTAMRLNGQDLGLTAAGYLSFATLSLNHGFLRGFNLLDVDVQNDGSQPNPSGLRVDASATGIAPVDSDWLTQRLLIDVRAQTDEKITRLSQATDVVRELFFALRNREFEQLSPQPDIVSWALTEDLAAFDAEWGWMADYSVWQSFMSVFLHPENLLLPSLRLRSTAPVPNQKTLEPQSVGEKTQAFDALLSRLDPVGVLTPGQALNEANQYISDLNASDGTVANNLLYPRLPAELKSDTYKYFIPPLTIGYFQDPRRLDVAAQRQYSKDTLASYQSKNVATAIAYLWEAWYAVPIEIALRLQKAGQYEAALDWFRLVYAYDLPLTRSSTGDWIDDNRKTFYGLAVEGSIAQYLRFPEWTINLSNPHQIATVRGHPYTRFTLMAIVQCLLDFADAQFASEAGPSISTARSLYLNALDLLSELQQVAPGDLITASNPQLAAMRQHAETNLSKLRNGRNIAGMLSVIYGGSDQTFFLQPTAYRYSTLIDRAKQLVGLAQQVENSYLASLEKKDAESYTALRATQDLAIANASINLQYIKVQEAADGVTLAFEQKAKVQDQYNHYSQLLTQGKSDAEQASLDLQIGKTVLEDVAAIGSIIAAPFTGGASLSVAEQLGPQALSDTTGLLSNAASYDRRVQDWQFQQAQASDDMKVADQQITVANDQQAQATQELTIARMQASNAQAAATFLATKFTNADLYRWMSGILGGVYAYFLQQATAMARLAENQLGFERQQRPLSVIQPDYWQPITTGTNTSANGSQPQNSAGLTGAERLLQDITQLDQYAFKTDQLKLQLTKTISLSELDPFAFQQFRDTGILHFGTPMSLFDSDFPGQYLRTIKQVRVSVIALIPPSQGIRATLGNHGISRVVIPNDAGGFQVAIVQRDPQLVALSSPINATGLFELSTQSSSQSPMLLPFEDLGVDTSWEFAMPRFANPFDYDTIADILISVDYTALDSPDYRRTVIRQLDQNTSADRGYSFRQQFADAWYELNNPDQSRTPMVVQFETEAADYRPNLENVAISQVVLYFVPADGANFEVQSTLTLVGEDQNGNLRTVSGSAATIDHVISTRRGNASNWLPMIGMGAAGTWALDLSTPDMRGLFKNGQIKDILFVITYNAQLPAWPT
jgi:hypothetical protein